MRSLFLALASITLVVWPGTPAHGQDMQRMPSPAARDLCSNRFSDDSGKSAVSVAKLPGWSQQRVRGKRLGVGSLLLENQDWE